MLVPWPPQCDYGRGRAHRAGHAHRTERNDTTPEPLLTPAQAAAVLAIPVTTLSRWRSERRELPYVRVGRVIRYRRADLDHWIETHTVHPR
ncbi:helix-turn-helix domain-containing protein [Bifidobacterium myosotis]|uniref:DNA-binding protein n=1 Tax=Bifidobacterium myosotis TaxID=1630166 RepID=A0A5M9ZFW5_9BIFI|nr:DNA-binding protein [Bifidobacterium myosotis]